jgi:FkbM family methyltransferase
MIKQELKRFLRRLGYDVARHSIQTSPEAQLQRILQAQRVDLVLDVGANEGQYAKSLRNNGYVSRIVSFEPLGTAHAKLVEAGRGDPLWEIAERTAIGDADGSVDIHVAANSVSSSVREMLPEHLRAAPESLYVSQEKVPVARLDRAAEPYMRPRDVLLLKIDTQGYEEQVLAGAARTLERAGALQVELSLVPLYEGQMLFLPMIERLEQLGFGLHALLPGFVDPQSGRTLQVDGVFVRRQP